MIPNKLIKNLEKLHFDSGSPNHGLLFVKKKYSKESISFSERLVLEKAESFGASAVFFRRIVKRDSIPQLFIFDNTNNLLSNDEIAQVHKKIWTSGIVPIYYVFDKTTLRVFDGKQPVEYKNGNYSISTIDNIPLIAKSLKEYEKYSAKLFANGSFWERKENQNRFLDKESSSKYLIKQLKLFKDSFLKEIGDQNNNLINKIIVQSILLKYLEERRDTNGTPGYDEYFFKKYNGSNSFCEVIRNKRLVDLFKELSVHFNGEIFTLKAKEEAILQNIDLAPLADFLDASLDDNQYVLWRLYEFNELPVELISRIYEEFLKTRSDAVYTPLHLAKFMVDECMPINIPKENYKVIDVSCGSGVFLVSVFKRLVQWQQKIEFEKTGKIKNFSRTQLQNILKKSIYGVDIEEDAVLLSAFSLSIALCDMLTPRQIWQELKFENLRKNNLQNIDFFKYIVNNNTKFDLVIGNPPFESQNDEIDNAIKDNNLTILCKIPSKQKAMLFLDQAMRLLKEHGLLSLVLPSGPLLYNSTAATFRKKFFESFKVLQIADFTALNPKGYLFEASISTAVVFIENSLPTPDHKVLHLTVQKGKPAKERIYFEIDHYDLHWIPQNIAKSDTVVWKANLFGGGLLYRLICQLKKNRTLNEFLKGKKCEGWVCAGGYTLVSKEKASSDSYIQPDAPHLYKKPKVEKEDFAENGIKQINIEKRKYFDGTRESVKSIFEPPHLLIKEVSGNQKFVKSYQENEYLVFEKGVFAIHSPMEQKAELVKIDLFLNKYYRLLKVISLIVSSRACIAKSSNTFNKKDFMDLPFPKNEEDLKLSKNEKIVIDDFLNYRLKAYETGERAEINITDAKSKHLSVFGQVLCENLNLLYAENNKKFHPHSTHIETESFICFPVIYGESGALPDIPQELNNGDLDVLIKNKQNAVLYQRIIRWYQPNIIYLIKPKKLRYWLKSVALQDASDVISDLVREGF